MPPPVRPGPDVGPLTKRALLLPAAVLLAFLLVGCGPRVTVPYWQRSVEAYVERQGGGDPTVLRDVTLVGDRRGFKVFNAEDPARSTDANGLLLGHRVIDGRPWFVYLVGIVDEYEVEQIRLAAMSKEPRGDYAWRVSPRDKQAERTYRAYNEQLAESRFPNRRDVPPDYLGFPRDADVFALTPSGDDRIIVTHTASGARWELDMNPRDEDEEESDDT